MAEDTLARMFWSRMEGGVNVRHSSSSATASG